MNEPAPACPLCDASHPDFRSLEDHLRDGHSLEDDRVEPPLRTAKVSFAERRMEFEQRAVSDSQSSEEELSRLLDRYLDAKRRVDVLWKKAHEIFNASDAQKISELPVSLRVLIFRMEEALDRAERELNETARTMASSIPHIRTADDVDDSSPSEPSEPTLSGPAEP